MKNHFGIPGPGGSLGCCAFCGKDFIAEILLNSPVKSFTVSGVVQTLYGHDKCVKKYAVDNLDVTTLPEASPLRLAYEKQSL